MLSMGFQNYMFSTAAARLTAKLRSLSFRAILRQDSKSFLHIRVGAVSLITHIVEFFDKDENGVRLIYGFLYLKTQQGLDWKLDCRSERQASEDQWFSGVNTCCVSSHLRSLCSENGCGRLDG